MNSYRIHTKHLENETVYEVYCTYPDGETELIEESCVESMGEAIGAIYEREGDGNFDLSLSEETD